MRKTRAKELRYLASIQKAKMQARGKKTAPLRVIYRRLKKAFVDGILVYNPAKNQYKAVRV